jgi:hypothetical protein
MNSSKAATKAPKRQYSPVTLKILFGLSGNKCAAPDCNNPIIKAGTAHSDDMVLGQICHIYALSNKGPRGKSGLTEAEKNAPDNLILCCPTHHAVVDGQYETYPASLLLEWKEKQERKFRERLSVNLNSVGYAELEIAAKALLAPSELENTDVTVIPPKDKIERNGLSASTTTLLQMGSAKAKEVEDVLLKAAQLDERFPDRLRNGFVQKYEELKSSGAKGDDIFLEIYEWAAGDQTDKIREAAGLCILSHLFVICDVFEK